MDCEMRPSDELMEFSVSTLWNTCTSKVLLAAVASLYGATEEGGIAHIAVFLLVRV